MENHGRVPYRGFICEKEFIINWCRYPVLTDMKTFPQARYSTPSFESLTWVLRAVNLKRNLFLQFILPSTPIWIIKLSIENGNFQKHALKEDDVKMQTLPYGLNEKFQKNKFDKKPLVQHAASYFLSLFKFCCQLLLAHHILKSSRMIPFIVFLFHSTNM